jgi:Fe-S-cluster containining protein
VGSDGPPRAWYADGLRFECRPDCGACCTNHDDYSYVYLTEHDCKRLARHLKLTRAEFAARYTELDEGSPVLRMDRPDCPFLDGTRCGVYAARPTQCRTFPFWPENLTSPVRWERLGKFCPGIGHGEVRSLRVIRSCLARRDREE